MQPNGGLPYKITLHCGELKWVQELDYKKLPFHYRFCHQIGHILRDCPNKAQVYKKKHIVAPLSVEVVKSCSVQRVAPLVVGGKEVYPSHQSLHVDFPSNVVCLDKTASTSGSIGILVPRFEVLLVDVLGDLSKSISILQPLPLEGSILDLEKDL